jgi:hypothetical protein
MRLSVVCSSGGAAVYFYTGKVAHPLAAPHLLFERCSHSKSGNSTARTFAPAIANCFRQHQSKYEQIFTEGRMQSTISTKDLKAKLDSDKSITIVETLAPERYREAHLPGALNIPPDKIKELAPQLLPNKGAEIVTYCTSLH